MKYNQFVIFDIAYLDKNIYFFKVKLLLKVKLFPKVNYSLMACKNSGKI